VVGTGQQTAKTASGRWWDREGEPNVEEIGVVWIAQLSPVGGDQCVAVRGDHGLGRVGLLFMNDSASDAPKVITWDNSICTNIFLGRRNWGS
jgi:hypothetical protein